MGRASLIALAAFSISTSHAACVADGPLATAKWIEEQQHSFYAETPQDAERFLSRDLLALLRLEWACRELCAIEADPWTGTQDGEALPPLKFAVLNRRSALAMVAMSYRFGWSDAPAQKVVPRTARLRLVLDVTDRCWKLDDLIDGDRGRSLKRALRQYDFHAP